MINESSVASVKHISRAVLATVIAFILVVCIFTANAFAGVIKEYNVVINDNGFEYTITTNETEPIEILNKANIVLGENDKINIAGFESGVGGCIVIDRLNAVIIDFNGYIKTYSVYADTVSEALDKANVDAEGCAVNYNLNAPVENGMVITVQSPKMVTVNYDGISKDLGVTDGTVGDVLAELGITLDSDDYVEPKADTEITDGIEINVFRVEVKTVSETEKIAYSIKNVDDSTLDQGTTQVDTQGVDGEKEITYKVVYINGEVSEKTEISSTITKNPVTEVRRVGTKPVAVTSNGIESYNGYTVGQTVKGKYSHYCACSICCGKSNGVTASGRKISNGMTDPHYVACNWLPLGSVIEVNGINYTVVDRGGSGLSTKGRIDIFTPEGHSAAIKGGTGSCSIKIVRLGW